MIISNEIYMLHNRRMKSENIFYVNLLKLNYVIKIFNIIIIHKNLHKDSFIV